MRKPLFLLLAWTALFAGKTNDDVNALVKAERLAEAFALSEERAAAGDPEGDQALAWFYDQGRYVIEDKAKAASYFRKCANSGLKHCQWRLGVMLDMGEGVPANLDEAFSLLSASAAQGYSDAYVSLGVMHAMGRGTPVDYAKSMESYRTGARLGEAHGFFGVGVLYNLGQGVLRDPVEAVAWFLIAHFEGDTQAKAAADRLTKDMSQPDFEKAVSIMNRIKDEFGLGKKAEKDAARPNTS